MFRLGSFIFFVSLSFLFFSPPMLSGYAEDGLYPMNQEGFHVMNIEWFACLDKNIGTDERIEIPLKYYGTETNRAVFRWDKRTSLFFFHSYRPHVDIICQNQVLRSYDITLPLVVKPASIRFGYCKLPSGMRMIITDITDKTAPSFSIESLDLMLNSEKAGFIGSISLCKGSDHAKI